MFHKELLENISIWSSSLGDKPSGRGRASYDAEKIYGVSKLRQLIMRLALSGALCDQRSLDEPSYLLIDRIKSRKFPLNKEGTKKQDLLDAIPLSEEFELPEGWSFVRLGDIAISQAGFAFKSSGFNEDCRGLPLIRIRDVGQPFSGTYYEGEYRQEFIVQKGDYLISMDGEFRVSKSTLDSALLNQRVSRLIFLSDEVSKEFIVLALQVQLSRLQGTKSYTTVDHLSGGQISNAIIALPPKGEQERIMEKFATLTILCDELESKLSKSLISHEIMRKSFLDLLLTSLGTSNLKNNWRKISNSFEAIFITDESVSALKLVIMRLAIMGKLVPQDSAEDSASLLIESFREEVSRLVADKLVRKHKDQSALSVEEWSHAPPKGWQWVRLGQIGDWGAGATPLRGVSSYYGGEIPWFKSGELTKDFISESEETITDLALKKCSLRLNKPGDVLLAMYGATIGKASILKVSGTTNQAICACTPYSGMSNEFLLLWLKAMRQDFISQGVGGAQPNISREKIIATPIALPPQAEQLRIVERVNKLMSICNELQLCIKQSRDLERNIADAFVD
jgi:type I restriction enzyme S subunit